MTPQEMTTALARPFHPDDVRLKPKIVKDNRALALSYVDARTILDRLDEVLGVGNWQDRYAILPDGSVVCRLSLKIEGKWITKADVGSPSEQPDAGDRLKAAFSDALKRAAVKFGVGRYLYRETAKWMDYDPVKKQIIRPGRTSAPRPISTAPVTTPVTAPVQKDQRANPNPPAPVESRPSNPDLPTSGKELYRTIDEADLRLANSKRCARYELITRVVQAGVQAGYPDQIARWTGPAIPFGVKVAREFENNAA